VPPELVEAIDRFIEKSKGFFRSRPEVAIAALEKFLKISGEFLSIKLISLFCRVLFSLFCPVIINRLLSDSERFF
jgi:hypothetical protein